MNINQIKKEFEKRGYEVNILSGGEYYLRKYGTIVDCIEDSSKYNLESLEQKLFSIEKGEE